MAQSDCRVILEGFLDGRGGSLSAAAQGQSRCHYKFLLESRHTVMELPGRGRVTVQRRPSSLPDTWNRAATHEFLPVEAIVFQGTIFIFIFF